MGGPCYAGNYHETRMAKALPALYAPTFDEVRLIPGRMAKAAAWSDLRGTARPDKPWLDGLPRLIFVADFSDLFSKAVPFAYIESEVFDVAASPKGSRHVYMLLTKQPARMALFGEYLAEVGKPWPGNVWAGTSVTGPKTAGRVDHLLKVPAKVRYVSLEPQWGPVDLAGRLDGVSLVIQGGESSQGKHVARPFDLAWARRVRDQCKAAGVPYFLKEVGSAPFDSFYRGGVTDQRLYLKDHHGGDWGEWSEDLRVRELPRAWEVAHA